MSKKFQQGKEFLWRTNGDCNKDKGGASTAGSEINHGSPHEEAAAFVLTELLKDRVFVFVHRNPGLDGEGIDFIIGRFVRYGERWKMLRIPIQHKPSMWEARRFAEANPCIPVWVHRRGMPVLDGKINILNIVVEVLAKVPSPYIVVFEQKLAHFESLRQEGIKTAS
ncbi:MAG: hypothetical protein Q8Q46_02235 [Candidatus Giovannonibacteria bacterium]|nr:hypothetical protein [Candidatus Giovannonibacteria bacterium]